MKATWTWTEAFGLLLAAALFAGCHSEAPVVQPVRVDIWPHSATVKTGGRVTFVASVTNAPVGESEAVDWSVAEGASGGTIDATGHYTAPAAGGVFHVVATSVADATKSASAEITVLGIAVSIVPKDASVLVGGTLDFTAAVVGTAPGQSTSTTWSVQEGAAGGAVTAAGRYTAPAAPGTFHVVATSVADPSKSDSATVTVGTTPVIVVSVAPRTSALVTGATTTFSAIVTGTGAGQSAAVTWSVREGAAGGTVGSTGQYTAPAAAGTYHVVATSVADPAKSDSATVTVTAVSVTISPRTVTVGPGATQTFSAGVSGVPAGQSTEVVWSVQEGASGGSVTSGGVYTAPVDAGTYHVVATSVADPSKSDVATVTVPAAPVVAVAVSPKTAALVAGGTATFTAAVTGTSGGQSTAVTWTVHEGAAGGTITSGGVYTAPAAAGTYHVEATSVADPTKSDTATVTVTLTPVVAVAVTPKTAALITGRTATFSASVTGTTAGQSTAVTWSVQEGASGGSVTSGGVYTAPAAAGTYHVVATSVADGTKSDSATVTVTQVAVAVTPKTIALTGGAGQTFSAAVTGVPAGQSTAVTWSVQEGAAGGTVTAGGAYTAPAAAGTYHVIATSVADTSKSDTATVTVTVVSVAVSPKTFALITGRTATFTATVTGTTAGQSTAVTWSVQEGASGGSVTTGGVYTAPATAGTYHVKATSVADATRSDSATVTVTQVAVAVSPKTVGVTTGATQSFSAAVTGVPAGGSTAVTWAVQEGVAGGSITSGGVYTAPTSTGSFHVVATSVADNTRSDSATVTVSVPVISVAISPGAAVVSPNATFPFSATVSGTTGGQSTAVTWSVQEGAAGGTITSGGLYTAPSSTGDFHVVATSVADGTKSATAVVSVSSLSILTADRRTVWNPGVTGGIPNRTTICRSVDAATYGNGTQDATNGIQAAIDACPAGQVVKLSAGTFTINGGNYLLLDRGITLRGSGPGQTTLQKTNGAKPYTEATGANPSPIVIVGPAQYSTNGTTTSVTASTNLTADAAKGSYSVTVASASGLSAGKVVLLDELSGASWQPSPPTDTGVTSTVWASADGRVVWQLHNPGRQTDDPLTLPAAVANQDAFSWFSRLDRPTSEVKQIASVSGTTVTFTTPVHISYRTSHTAQLSVYGHVHTQNAGVEDLKVIGGDNGNIRFHWAANCWAKNIENTVWHDEGFAVENSFKVEIRDSYVHDAAWAQPGGAGYAISLSAGTSEVLVENSISVRANKVMVARCSGAGSVFGYNYVDDGYINTNGAWIEIGLNASHMVGPHHVLFEGNYGFNFDSDKTHGNSIYHTVFRNHLSGFRAPFPNQAGGTIDDYTQAGNGPRRCAGAGYYSYWMSYIGNVLGLPGKMGGWVYEAHGIDGDAIWKLGWDDWDPYPIDPKVLSTAVRHGNFDYLTNTVKWDPGNSDHTLPPSLYLSAKPAFFDAGRGYVWPWVDPTAATPVLTLPAKARFDAGTPFTQP